MIFHDKYVCRGPVLGEGIFKENLCKLQGVYVRLCGDELGHFCELVYYYQYFAKSVRDW